MKTQSTKDVLLKKGLTLIELTVVIVVLLSLIGVLFVGAGAWKRGADKSACIVNQRNYQQAVRSYANLNNLDEGDTATSLVDVLITEGFLTNGTATDVVTQAEIDTVNDANTNGGFNPGDAGYQTPPTLGDVEADAIVGTCPLDGDEYEAVGADINVIPATGVLWIQCANRADTDGGHTPSDTSGW